MCISRLSSILRLASITFCVQLLPAILLPQETPDGSDLPLTSRTVSGIEVGKSTLNQIKGAYGGGSIIHVKHTAQLCYIIQSRPEVRMVLSSEDDASSHGQTITRISLRLEDEAPTKSVPCFALSSHTISTLSGLRLGVTPREALAILGEPRSNVGNEMTFDWTITRKISTRSEHYSQWNDLRDRCFAGADPYSEINSSILMEFKNNHAVSIEISRWVSTC